MQVQVPDHGSVNVHDVEPGTLLLDVREDDEWAAAHVESAIHIPMSRITAAVAAGIDWLTPDDPVVVMCAVGARSARVADWLNAQGYTAINLDGGINAWIEAGRPVVSGTGPSVR